MNRRQNKSLKQIAMSLGLVAAIMFVHIPTIKAEEIGVVLPYVVDNHDRVRAAEARLTAARNRAREALGDWFPTLGQTANAGHERQQNDGGDDSSTGFNEYDITLTQLLWDFGSTNAAIDKARLQVEEARYSVIETKQSLILEAITAYMNLVRARATVGFATESEANIRRQTGLEEALVSLGSGFSTDVLQAKTQLAGAQARKAQNDGALINSLNRYKAVFGRMPDDLAALGEVPYPAAYIPTSLTQAVDVALETNPALKNAILAADIAIEDVRIARADNFFPRIEASGERKFKKNVGGTIGSEQETLAKVEMTLDFNLGFTAINTLKASKSDLSASTFTAADTRRNIEEQVRNAWQQLDTARRTASHLNNQANIAAAFLELARNERQLGRRSLIDVLSGETNLINSKSDALSAETDVIIAAYGLLAATGQLDYDVIKRSKGTKAPIFIEEQQPSAELQKSGDIDSLMSEDNRSSKELMAMLRRSVKTMPIIDKAPTIAPTKSAIADLPTKPAKKIKASPVISVDEKPVKNIWDDSQKETSNYNVINEALDSNGQIASLDTSNHYDVIALEYVPSEGDHPVHSTPDELATVNIPDTNITSQGSTEPVSDTVPILETAAVPEQIEAQKTTSIDLDSALDISASSSKPATPRGDSPSIAEAFKSILSFLEGVSDAKSTNYETQTIAALDWTEPFPTKAEDTETSYTLKSAPASSSDDESTPNIFQSIVSFFDSITKSGDSNSTSLPSVIEETSSRTVAKDEIGLEQDVPSTQSNEIAEVSNEAGPAMTSLLNFFSSVFSLDSVAEKVNYSKLDADPDEEFGR